MIGCELQEDVVRTAHSYIKKSILMNPFIEDAIYKTTFSEWDDVCTEVVSSIAARFFFETVEPRDMYNKYLDALMSMQPRIIKIDGNDFYVDMIKDMRISGIISNRIEKNVEMLEKGLDVMSMLQAFVEDIGYIVRYCLIVEVMDFLTQDKEFLDKLAYAFAAQYLKGKELWDSSVYHTYKDHMQTDIIELAKSIEEQNLLKEIVPEKQERSVKQRL